MFEQMCMQKDNNGFGGYSGAEEDVWVTQDIKFADSEKKDEWISADENLFKASTTEDIFKSSDNKKIDESNLAAQSKNLSSKKYSENLSLANYSSSSSDEESRSSSDEEENVFGHKSSPKSNK